MAADMAERATIVYDDTPTRRLLTIVNIEGHSR
jgi:hypothetical protein